MLASFTLQTKVFKLMNKQDATRVSPGKTAQDDQYTIQAPRSAQLSVKAEL